MDEFQVLYSRGERILRSTAAVYRQDRHRWEPFASAVFLQYQSRHFVIGAAHALVELRNARIGVQGEDSIVEIRGQVLHTGEPGHTDCDSDQFDVAFIPLGKEQLGRLRGTLFLSESDLHQPGPDATDSFYVVGFISRDLSRREVEGKGVAWASGFLARAAGPELYRRRGVSARTHLLLSFDRRRTRGRTGQISSPRLNGMSGCGVWRRDPLQDRDKLVAILTEHHQKGGKFIVATKVSVMMDALAAFATGPSTE